MSSKDQKPGSVLVTGASSGIGADLARLFAREGRQLVLVARSRERLETLSRELEEEHGIVARVLASDLASPGTAEAIHRELEAQGVLVDTLVNDAGFGMHGPFVELDAARQSQMVQVNAISLTEMCRLFAPGMVRRGHGRILNVASTAAFQPGPLMAVYCATKAYVLSFSEALANELRGAGVTVTCLCPGATETRFADAAGVSVARLFRAGAVMPSMAVAEAGHSALSRGADLEVPGFRNRLLAASVRLVPTRAAAGLARRFLEAP
jgi:hypothetical protein